MPTHSSTFASKLQQLCQLRSENILKAQRHPAILIVGAGPAGLLRAIIALCHGNPTTVIEKRPEDGQRRENIVVINPVALEILKEYGIYDYLVENHLVDDHKKNKITIRIMDLECAMKSIIAHLSQEPVIIYNAQIQQPVSDRHFLIKREDTYATMHADILVIADGANSSTYALLGGKRIQVTPKSMQIGVLLKNQSQEPQRKPQTITNALQTCADIAMHIGHTIRSIPGFFSNRQPISIAVSAFFSPQKSHYLTFAFDKQHEHFLQTHAQHLISKTALLEEIKRKSLVEECLVKKNHLQTFQTQPEDFLKYWTYRAFCQSNIETLGLYIKSAFGLLRENGPHPSIKKMIRWRNTSMKITMFETWTDKAETCSGFWGGCAFLLAGDALTTADIFLGLGCNLSITTSRLFNKFLHGLNNGYNVHYLLDNYEVENNIVIEKVHKRLVDACGKV